MGKVYWPKWVKGPDGVARLFQTEADVPKDWGSKEAKADDSAKISAKIEAPAPTIVFSKNDYPRKIIGLPQTNRYKK